MDSYNTRGESSPVVRQTDDQHTGRSTDAAFVEKTRNAFLHVLDLRPRMLQSTKIQPYLSNGRKVTHRDV